MLRTGGGVQFEAIFKGLKGRKNFMNEILCVEDKYTG